MERFLKWVRSRLAGAQSPADTSTQPRGTPVLPGGLIPEERRRSALLAEQEGPAEDATDELSIADESGASPDPEPGFDPYNTGSYDRSNNWSRRPGK